MTEQIPEPRSPLTRILWRLVLVLLVVGCVLTLFAILGGRLSETQAKIILSSFGIALYATCGLVCAAAQQRAGARLGGTIGAVAALVAGTLFLGGIWLEMASNLWWWQALGVATVNAIAGAHSSGVAFVVLAPRFEPLRTLTRAASWCWAFGLSAMILLQRGDPFMWRAIGVLSTLVVFGSLALPIVSRLSKRDDGAGS